MFQKPKELNEEPSPGLGKENAQSQYPSSTTAHSNDGSSTGDDVSAVSQPDAIRSFTSVHAPTAKTQPKCLHTENLCDKRRRPPSHITGKFKALQIAIQA